MNWDNGWMIIVLAILYAGNVVQTVWLLREYEEKTEIRRKVKALERENEALTRRARRYDETYGVRGCRVGRGGAGGNVAIHRPGEDLQLDE